MKPIIKWSGGKRKELPIIKKYKPSKISTYYEPFLGGGAVWLDLNCSKNVVSDNFSELIDFYNIIKKNKWEVISYINNVVREYNSIDKSSLSKSDFEEVSKKYYYKYRDNEFQSDNDKALKFYIIRQLSFSGMLRFNQDGKYNVPFGWYKTIKEIDFGNKLINLLENTEILNCDWSETVKTANTDDFVFIDPPYTRAFQQYSPYGHFNENDHIKLSEWFKNSSSNNMIILNKDDFTYSLYKDYIVDEYDYKYSIQYRDRMTENDSNALHFVAINYDINHNKYF